MARGATSDGHLSESELQQEHEHFQKIVNAFLYYKLAPHCFVILVGGAAYLVWCGTCIFPFSTQK